MKDAGHFTLVQLRLVQLVFRSFFPTLCLVVPVTVGSEQFPEQRVVHKSKPCNQDDSITKRHSQ